MRRLAAILVCALTLPACTSTAIPETVAVEVGTGIRHEAGEPATRNDTFIVKSVWRFKK